MRSLFALEGSPVSAKTLASLRTVSRVWTIFFSIIPFIKAPMIPVEERDGAFRAFLGDDTEEGAS